MYFSRFRFAFIMVALLIFTGVGVHRLLAQAATPITACQNITANGSYIISNNLSGSSTCISIRGGVTSVTLDGNGKTISVSSGDAVEVADYGSGAPHHVTVKNLTSTDGVRTYGDSIHHVTFENLNVGGVTIYGSDDTTIKNNTIGSAGISVQDKDADWHPFRPIVTGNTITGSVGHTTKILLEVVGGKFHPCARIDAVVTNNTITNNRNDPPPEATGSMRIRCATHSVVTGNYIRNTGTTIGLYLRDESDDGRYENNTFWVNTQEAIRVASGNTDKTFPSRNLFRSNIFRSDVGKSTYLQGIGTSNTFDYNIFWSAGTNDMINGGHGNAFDHNTFYTKNSGSVISFDLDTSPADSYTNNIFSYSGSSIYGYATFVAARLSSNRNLFHNRAGTVSFGSQGSSLATWRTTTGNDAQSVEGDPQFTNPGAGTFTLEASSPARGIGSGGTDVGAIAYGSTAPGGSGGPTSCTESWTCSAFSACTNGTQTRTCTDANTCGTTTSRPALSQSCGTACTESWTCGAWSTCTNSSQSRTCTDSRSCGTTTSRPALTQSCSTAGALSCGTACASCTNNRILVGSCTTAQRTCDGTNDVRDISVNDASITAGQTLSVEIDYACYAGTPLDDNIALWYYNGTSWRLIQNWPAPLTGCDTTPNDTDGTVTKTFTPDKNAGTHYIRAVLTAGGQSSDPLANSSSCPTTMRYGNVDDLAFTVSAASTPTPTQTPPPSSCTESWTCDEWSICTNNSQTRTCTDANSCGSTDDRPVLTQSCSTPVLSSLDITSPSPVSNLVGR